MTDNNENKDKNNTSPPDEKQVAAPDKDKKEDKTSPAAAIKAEDKTKAEEKQPAAAKTKPAKKHAKRSASHLSGLMSSLALLGVILLAAGGYYLWMELQEYRNASITGSRQLNSKLTDTSKQTDALRDRLASELESLKTSQKNLTESFSALLNTSSHLRNDWLMTEAEYLIKLANHRLMLERDVNTAVVALQAADERLREVADPGLVKIRQRIAEDINQLRAVSQADISGMSFTLTALAQDIEQLPLNTPDPESIARRMEQQTTSDKVEDWRDLPKAIWEDIKGLVVIRNHADPIQPLLSPEQHFFLSQNLRLQIEQARLALLNGQEKVFQERLQTTREWVVTYFDKSHNLTQHVLTRLDELKQINIKPDLPDVSDTFRALYDYRNALQVNQAQATQPEATATEPTTDKAPTEEQAPQPSEQAEPAEADKAATP